MPTLAGIRTGSDPPIGRAAEIGRNGHMQGARRAHCRDQMTDEADLGGLMDMFRRVVVSLTVLGGLLALSPATAHATPAPTTFVTMVGDSGDYVTGGASRYWAGNQQVTFSGSASTRLTVNASGGPSGSSFTFLLAAPTGKSLTTGQYTASGGTRGPDTPQLMVFGDGRSCGEEKGRFTVLDIDVAARRLWIVYEQHCGSGLPAAYGEIRITSPAATPTCWWPPARSRGPRTIPGWPPVRCRST